MALAPASAFAATQQQVNDAVAAGAAWVRTQQNASTGQITGFGGDYALSALSAAGIERLTSRAACRRIPRHRTTTPGNSRPSALRARQPSCSATRPASTSSGSPSPGTSSHSRRRVQPRRRSRGIVRQRCEQHRGLHRARTGPGRRTTTGPRAHQRLPRRPAAHRRRLELRCRDHRCPEGGSRKRRHDRGGSCRDLRDRRLVQRPRGSRRRGVPRGPSGPGDRGTGQRRLDSVGGVRPERLRDRPAGWPHDHVGGKNPVDYLLSEQVPAGGADQGAFLFGGSANLYSSRTPCVRWRGRASRRSATTRKLERSAVPARADRARRNSDPARPRRRRRCG